MRIGKDIGERECIYKGIREREKRWEKYNFSGVDQYLAILDPLEYPFKATRVVSWQMISLVWALGFTSSFGTAFQMITAARQSPW